MSDKQAKSFWADLFEWIEMIILSACIVMLLFTFVARPARVDGASMEETLHNGEMLLISDLFFEPEHGDVIVFQKINSPHPAPIVKRVIATEGETIDIDFDTWRVTITDKNGNSRVLDEGDYRKLATDARVTSDYDFPMTVGEGQLFVMGDNRNHSMDSRSSAIGLVDEQEIIG
ncbi:MAG: signal peptidase I, partial [Clostridia bacterium]|nr:signal peptidase I [Clostridia bacterium]